MARSKKGGGSRFKRRSVDWVVNDATYGGSIAVANTGLVALPLTIPQMQQDIATLGIGGGGPTTAFGWNFPEPNARLRVKAVMGHFTTVPSVWAVGSAYRWLARIVKKPMDLATGTAIADALYSLADSEYANERFSWQTMRLQRFDLGAAGETVSVRANVNQSLEPDEALWFIFENISGVTQTITLQTYLRTLVET